VFSRFPSSRTAEKHCTGAPRPNGTHSNKKRCVETGETLLAGTSLHTAKWRTWVLAMRPLSAQDATTHKYFYTYIFIHIYIYIYICIYVRICDNKMYIYININALLVFDFLKVFNDLLCFSLLSLSCSMIFYCILRFSLVPQPISRKALKCNL
jgi:hypothetical protein